MTPVPGPGRGRSGRTHYLEVSDLGSECEIIRISWVARFYEASGASARIDLTYDPVETKHPQARESYHNVPLATTGRVVSVCMAV